MKIVSIIRTLGYVFSMLMTPTIVLAQQVINEDLYVTGKLGVGTTSPTTQLHVNGAFRVSSSYGYMTVSSTDANYIRFNTNLPAFYFNKPLYLQNTVVRGIGRALIFYTSTNTQCLTLLGNRVGVGTQNPIYSLDVNGTIRAKEILVEGEGADFVFSNDYQLRPLSEVKAFIAENKHLPEIQSAKEMQENGVSVSELQIQLLQKIEELTLYLIEQEQTIKELRQEVEQLKK